MEKPQLLIVEDDSDLSEMLSAYFRVQNYEVMTAAWGEEAVRIALENPFDLIVLDIRLPDIDGYEVCRQLRTNRRTQDLPIIFLTERRDRVDKLQGLELGVVDYITKPFDIQELRLRIRNAINRAKRQALVNPVTDLPEGSMLDERFAALMDTEDKWAILQLSITGLTQFRDNYGFVAADDVMRAVTLMVRNAVREFGSENDFIGHNGPEDFLIITKVDNVLKVRDRIQARVEQSREYFYPLRDSEKARQAMEANLLKLSSGMIDHGGGPYTSVEQMRTALQAAMQ